MTKSVEPEEAAAKKADGFYLSDRILVLCWTANIIVLMSSGGGVRSCRVFGKVRDTMKRKESCNEALGGKKMGIYPINYGGERDEKKIIINHGF